MKNAKKIIIGVVVVALVAGGAAGVAVYLKSNNKETVGVVSVDSLDRLKQIVASLVVGEEATIRVLRDGQEMEFSFVIQSREELT